MKTFIRKLIIFLAIPVFAIGNNIQIANAVSYSITGTIRDSAGNSMSGAYVYATAPSGSDPMYGPVATNVNGAYTLPITVSGTYDIHFTPPANTGASPIVDSNVSVTSNQVINHNFSLITNTLSGALTDGSGNPLSGITIKLLKSNSPIYQSTTDANGNYSISAPAAYYYLNLSGNLTGISSFTLNQQNTASINLLTGNQTLNLAIKTATMTVTPHSNNGQLLWGPNVTARATSGITSLYPGDPGTSISLVNSNGFSANGTSGTITTIVGATYAASGLEATSYTTSVCEGIPNTGSYWDCLRLPLTVTGDVSFDLPSASPAVRTFSGVLTDSSGSPISGATVTLFKYGDTTTYASTDASGHFSISAQAKKYSLKVNGGSLDGMSSYTLTQGGTNPSIDLTTGNMTQDLQINTATLTVSAFDGSGNPAYGKTVNAQTSSGTSHLYLGDPGETTSVISNGFSTDFTTNIGTIGTIVGASYSAKGLHVTGNINGSICDTDTTPYWNCLTTPYTVTGSASINVPQ